MLGLSRMVILTGEDNEGSYISYSGRCSFTKLGLLNTHQWRSGGGMYRMPL